jgi:hypothetical protein
MILQDIFFRNKEQEILTSNHLTSSYHVKIHTCQGNSPGIALTPPTIFDAGDIPQRQPA